MQKNSSDFRNKGSSKSHNEPSRAPARRPAVPPKADPPPLVVPQGRLRHVQVRSGLERYQSRFGSFFAR